MSKEAVAVVSTDILHEIAGKYVGKDDPVAMIRGQAGLPAMGEILEAFTFPHLVSGWMRGSHNGPIMPVAVADATPSRFDGPPRVIGLGFQLAEGKLVGPADLLADKAFDGARQTATMKTYPEGWYNQFRLLNLKAERLTPFPPIIPLSITRSTSPRRIEESAYPTYSFLSSNQPLFLMNSANEIVEFLATKRMRNTMIAKENMLATGMRIGG